MTIQVRKKYAFQLFIQPLVLVVLMASSSWE